MATIQDVIGDYTPLSNNVVKKLKLVRGAIACKVFFTSNLEDRVCRMGQTRIAQELGLEVSTVSKGLKWLVEEKYLEQAKEHTVTDPAHYRCTEKFYSLAKGIDLINRGIDLINPPIDLINQEEEIKEESKEVTAVLPRASGGQRQQGRRVVPAYKVLIEVTPKAYLNNVQIASIEKIVGSAPEALDKWRRVVTAWAEAGHSKVNITGMLDWFKNGIPQHKNGNGQVAPLAPDKPKIKGTVTWTNPVTGEITVEEIRKR